MRVLSLFDGISCGRVALDYCNIPVTDYLASEIEPSAITVAKSNYPSTVHLGNVKGVSSSRVGKIDLLIGGPPCQSFSIAGSGKGFSDERGVLMFDYMRLLDDTKPKFFLMENVCMDSEYIDFISRRLGVSPIRLDSSLFSAQQRVRMYWTNIPIDTPPLSNNAVLADVMRLPPSADKRHGVPIRIGTVKGGGQGDRIYSPYGKAITLGASSGGTAGPGNMLVGSQSSWRRLVIEECEELQTLPRGYTCGVPLHKRHKLLGNCWTVTTVAWLLSGLAW